MRKRPTQTELFDVLFGIAGRDGREERLFGNDIALARPAFERMLIGKDFPCVYLEFPLLGTPGFDVLAGYRAIGRGERFADGAGYGRQDLFDWFAEICADGISASVGFEVDTSAGVTDVAGVYMQRRRSTDLVRPFLASMGEEGRADAYLGLRQRMPSGWPPSYVGLFPGRAGLPMRIGGYLSPAGLARCAGSPEHLKGCFDQIGFTAYDHDMLCRCSELMGLAPEVDFQFDVHPDGSLGNTFGVSLSIDGSSERNARACMTDGYGAQAVALLERWGLADDRWRLIADSAYARHIGYENEDGSEGRLALCVLSNFAKVKFVDGVPHSAKFYLTCLARDVRP